MSIRGTHQRTLRGSARGRALATAGAGLLLLAVGCGTGDAPAEPPTEDPGGSSGADGEPSDDPTGPETPAELGDWAEVPAGAILVASVPGTAVLAVGEPDGGDGTREVAAYDPAGEELWTHAGVIEDYYQPTTMATGAGVAVLSPDGDSVALTMLDWADGSELWSLPADELGSCHEWRFADLSAPDVLTLTNDGAPCPGSEPDRAGAITIDPTDGTVREEHLPSSGTITTVAATATEEVWSAETTEAELTLQRFDPAGGEVDARTMPWDIPLADDLQPRSDDEQVTVNQVTADLAIVQRWAEDGLAASALLDWTQENGADDLLQPADAVEPCFGEALTAVDVQVEGCIRVDITQDQAPVQSLGFDGQERWSMPGWAGLDMEVPAQVGPVPVGERLAWVVSTGEDLLTAVDVRTGDELWTLGEGEGAGYVTFGHVSAAGVLTAAVTAPDGPEGQLLRIDTATGAELDRQDIPGGWLSSTESAAVLSSPGADQPSLLTLVPAG
ncbi:PQQ-binding-like beta-propeller repeat protein [Ruania albidiflava]|uniref:outer membrane protein assembly factor BamB family protein n=1 Tax=Ruania albidiflava TaxID=366586 RepID=UPI0003B44CF1|nr:PQQ-binding-like beta-propeller repeat protein [Ruania albidiflava]